MKLTLGLKVIRKWSFQGLQQLLSPKKYHRARTWISLYSSAANFGTKVNLFWWHLEWVVWEPLLGSIDGARLTFSASEFQQICLAYVLMSHARGLSLVNAKRRHKNHHVNVTMHLLFNAGICKTEAFRHVSTCLRTSDTGVVKKKKKKKGRKNILDCGCEMNGRCMQTGVGTDHCNYGALGESSFLRRFICHINKGISGSASRGRGWQRWKFEKINELWQCRTWGEEDCARSSGVYMCWHRVSAPPWTKKKKKKKKDGERLVIVTEVSLTSWSL